MDILLQEACRRLREIRKIIEPQAVRILGQQNFDFIEDTCTKHPFIVWIAIVISFFSLIPLMCFMIFVFITLLITLVCFIVIEGSLLAVGGLIFAGIVGFISVLVFLAAIGIAFSIWTLKFLRKIVTNTLPESSLRNQEVKTESPSDSSSENNDNKSKDS